MYMIMLNATANIGNSIFVLRKLTLFLYITGGRSSTSVNGDIAIQWEWSNFDHS